MRSSQIRKHYPPVFFLLIELVFGILGFAGMGWIFSGRGSIGILLAIISPILAWVGVPSLIVLLDLNATTVIGPLPILVYLLVSTLVSITVLAGLLFRKDREKARRDFLARQSGANSIE